LRESLGNFHSALWIATQHLFFEVPFLFERHLARCFPFLQQYRKTNITLLSAYMQKVSPYSVASYVYLQHPHTVLVALKSPHTVCALRHPPIATSP